MLLADDGTACCGASSTDCWFWYMPPNIEPTTRQHVPDAVQAGYLYLTNPQRLHDMMCELGLGDALGEDGSNSAAAASGDDG